MVAPAQPLLRARERLSHSRRQGPALSRRTATNGTGMGALLFPRPVRLSL